jgi:hypothetical protein
VTVVNIVASIESLNDVLLDHRREFLTAPLPG